MEKKGKNGQIMQDFWKKIDPDKLRATERFMKKKGLSLEDELLAHIEKLFQRHVPKDVREYLDITVEETSKASDSPSERTETF